jgi:hypothetical protein
VKFLAADSQHGFVRTSPYVLRRRIAIPGEFLLMPVRVWQW